MQNLDLNALEEHPIISLLTEVGYALASSEEGLEIYLWHLNKFTREEWTRRERAHERGGLSKFPHLDLVPHHYVDEVISDIEDLDLSLGGIGWFFADDGVDMERSISMGILQKVEAAELECSGLLVPDDGWNYSEKLFRRVMGKAEDWEIELLLEIDEIIRPTRIALSYVAAAFRILEDAPILDTTKQSIRSGLAK